MRIWVLRMWLQGALTEEWRSETGNGLQVVWGTLPKLTAVSSWSIIPLMTSARICRAHLRMILPSEWGNETFILQFLSITDGGLTWGSWLPGTSGMYRPSTLFLSESAFRPRDISDYSKMLSDNMKTVSAEEIGWGINPSQPLKTRIIYAPESIIPLYREHAVTYLLVSLICCLLMTKKWYKLGCQTHI